MTNRLRGKDSRGLIVGAAFVVSAASALTQQATTPDPKNWTAAENLTGAGEYHWMAGNWKYFLAWADKFLEHTRQSLSVPADRPVPRTDRNSMLAHAELLEKRKKGRIDIYFIGDSITRRWGALDYPELLANWTSNFFGWNAADFGWGADTIQNILWRLENGELDGVHPRIIVVLAGTNNVGSEPGDESKVADVARGLHAIVDSCRRRAPDATILLTGIFPRNDNMAVMPEINRINESLARLADGRKIRYLNVNDRLADKDGRLLDGMMDERDKLHPTIRGYQVWADALKPIFTELLGPPAAVDHAPPPTGDPSARSRSGIGRVRLNGRTSVRTII